MYLWVIWSLAKFAVVWLGGAPLLKREPRVQNECQNYFLRIVEPSKLRDCEIG